MMATRRSGLPTWALLLFAAFLLVQAAFYPFGWRTAFSVILAAIVLWRLKGRLSTRRDHGSLSNRTIDDNA